ncbi:hypothetical protein FKM82_002352 [Ascaphus truei]
MNSKQYAIGVSGIGVFHAPHTEYSLPAGSPWTHKTILPYRPPRLPAPAAVAGSLPSAIPLYSAARAHALLHAHLHHPLAWFTHVHELRSTISLHTLLPVPRTSGSAPAHCTSILRLPTRLTWPVMPAPICSVSL